MDGRRLRKNLVELLRGGQAFVTVEKALEGLLPANRTRCPAGSPHSVYELIEHMRLAQEDILRYTLDSSWRSPPWPEGYWPAAGEAIAEPRWEKALRSFFRDRDDMIRLAGDPSRDLTEKIPHGEGRTYLRECLLVADHNAFHTGQIVLTRRLLGDWEG